MVITPTISWKRQTTERQNRDGVTARTTKWYQKRTFGGEENILPLDYDDYTTTSVKINTTIHLNGLNFHYVNNSPVNSNSSPFPT